MDSTENENRFLEQHPGNTEAAAERVKGAQELEKLFSENFYGLDKVGEELRQKFQTQEYPPMPSQEKIEKAKELGMVCVLRIYEDQRPPEWKFFLPNILPETAFKDYLEQTRLIRDYLKKHGLASTEELEECSDDKLTEMAKAFEASPKNNLADIAALEINQRHRNSKADMSYYANVMSEDPGTRDMRCPKLGPNFEATKETMDGKYIRFAGRFEDKRSFSNGKFREQNEDYEAKNGTQTLGTSWPMEQGVRVVI